MAFAEMLQTTLSDPLGRVTIILVPQELNRGLDRAKLLCSQLYHTPKYLMRTTLRPQLPRVGPSLISSGAA